VLGPVHPLAAKLVPPAMELAGVTSRRIAIEVYGALAENYTRLLTVAGAERRNVQGYTDQPVNYVNAPVEPLTAASR